MRTKNQRRVNTERPGPTRHSRSLLGQCARLMPMSVMVLGASAAHHAAQAADFYVSPSGGSGGNGSLIRPWNLQTALNHPSSIKPNDTIYLRGGTYKGGFTSKLKGAAGSPITVRSYPGEWATIDPSSVTSNLSLAVQGPWVTFRDFEVTNSAIGRVFRPGEIINDQGDGAMGINVRAAKTKFINLVIHDTVSNGIGLWMEAADSEVYGCIIYNCGITRYDHGIYTNGFSPNAKLIRDNIILNNVGTGISMHAARNTTTIEGYEVEGNILSNNGLFEPDLRNWTMGTAANVLERIRIVDNFTYQSSAGLNVQLKYRSPGKSVLFQGNYFAGGNFKLLDGAPATLTSNCFVAFSRFLETPKSSLTYPSSYTWNNNAYFVREDPGRPYSWPIAGKTRQLSFLEWRTATGFDENSSYASAKPRSVDVFMRPNLYQPGRANIIVYNWLQQDSVDVNVSSVLKSGQRYEVLNAQDVFAPPVASGTYNGSPIRLPLKGLTVAAPVGDSPNPPQPTGAEFNTFVLISN
jgi:hypothetical protein